MAEPQESPYILVRQCNYHVFQGKQWKEKKTNKFSSSLIRAFELLNSDSTSFSTKLYFVFYMMGTWKESMWLYF